MSKRQPRSRSRALALEPRVLFDGALVDSVAVDALHLVSPDSALAHAVPAADAPPEARAGREMLWSTGNLVADFTRLPQSEAGSLRTAVGQVETLMQALAASPRYEQVMQEAFGTASSNPAGFQSAIEGVRTELAGGDLGIELVVRDARGLRGAAGAYSTVAHLDLEVIYLNADWLALVTPSALRDVLVKEVGRALDQRVHGSDSAGDKAAEKFARAVSAFAAETRAAAKGI